MADEWKPERVGSSALIPVGGSNFMSMNSVDDLNALQDQAPIDHQILLQRLKAAGTVKGQDQEESTLRHAPAQRRSIGFGIGARVKDREQRRKGVIIQAMAGYTKKTHTPVHKVSDENGNTWLAKQTNLKLLL